MITFNVTYAIITPESAENGDYEETGMFCESVSLREAIDSIGRFATEADCWPISLSNAPRWFTNSEYGECYRTGEREERSFHIPDKVTASSRIRIARLLGMKISERGHA